MDGVDRSEHGEDVYDHNDAIITAIGGDAPAAYPLAPPEAFDPRM
jgi:hypothetical protein